VNLKFPEKAGASSSPVRASAEKSFDVLIQEYRPMMLSYAVLMMKGDKHRAEDIVQEASLTALNNLERFDTSRSFPKWLRGIIRNKSLEDYRKHGRAPLTEDPAVIEGMENVYSKFDTPQAEENWHARISVLQDCVAHLNPRMRQTVEMFYKNKCSLAEISHQLSVNVMAVGQRLSRARKLIKSCIETRIS